MKDAARELRLQEHPLYFKSLRLHKLAHPTFKCFANLTEMFGFCQDARCDLVVHSDSHSVQKKQTKLNNSLAFKT